MTSELAALPTSSASAAGKRRLEFIDALRGFACLWVLLHHSFEHVPLSGKLADLPLDLVVHFSRIGWLGVSLFLVLSGFCLYYPLVRKAGPQGAELHLKEFVRRRALRILPPYFAALTIFTVVAWWARDKGGEAVGTKDVILHALMLHNLLPSTFASINPAFWSLALEVQLYAVFPLLVWMAARRGLTAIVLSTLAVALVTQFAAFAKFGLAMHWGADLAVAYHSLPARCFEFVLGMCAAAAVAHPNRRHFRMAARAAALLIIPALWFVLFVSRFGPLCDPVWGVVFACLVVMLASVPHEQFTGRGILSAFARLGVVSYSVYLVHQPLIDLLRPEHFGLVTDTRFEVLTFGMARIGLLIAIGVGFFLLLERPFLLRAGQRARPVLPAPAR